MIKDFVDCYMNHKEEIRKRIMFCIGDDLYPSMDYGILAKCFFDVFCEHYISFDEIEVNIVKTDSYQGNLLLLANDLSDYRTWWACAIGYGSCCVCDTIERANGSYGENKDIDDFMTLLLHIVQGLKEIPVLDI